MQSLEALERETPEFQELTKEQQSQRRRFATAMISWVISDHQSPEFTANARFKFICDLLELHLTGKIDKVLEEPVKRKH